MKKLLKLILIGTFASALSLPNLKAQEKQISLSVGAEHETQFTPESNVSGLSNRLFEDASLNLNDKSTIGVTLRQYLNYGKNTKTQTSSGIEPYFLRNIDKKSFIGLGGEATMSFPPKQKKTLFLGIYPIFGTEINKNWNYLTFVEDEIDVVDRKYTGTRSLIWANRFTRKFNDKISGYLQGTFWDAKSRGTAPVGGFNFRIAVVYRLPDVKIGRKQNMPIIK